MNALRAAALAMAVQGAKAQNGGGSGGGSFSFIVVFGMGWILGVVMTLCCLAGLAAAWGLLGAPAAPQPALTAPSPAQVQTVTVETTAADTQVEASEPLLGPTMRAAGPPAEYMKGVTVPELRALAKRRQVPANHLSRATRPVLVKAFWRAGVHQ